MGMYLSHRGNDLFPAWECIIPNVGNITNITTNITPNYLIIKRSDVCDVLLAKIKKMRLPQPELVAKGKPEGIGFPGVVNL